jgi:5-hydroxyisourate hydrolase
MSGISTHVLDITLGKPVSGLAVRLEHIRGGVCLPLTAQMTDGYGRCSELLAREQVRSEVYRLVFETGNYFGQRNVVALYPEVTVTFTVREEGGNYHIPLLLSPNGFTTYRGS